jgi:single-strand DNA-binding protein
MKGVNKVILVGNLGDDPEIRNLDGNLKVAKFSLATNETYKDSNGQVQTQTDWHIIVVWRGLADLAEKYLHKGSMVYLEGKLKTRSYEDKQGEKRYVTEVIGENIVMLDKSTNYGFEDKV